MQTHLEVANVRCVTPPWDGDTSEDEDEIPHLMKPYSSDIEEEDDEHILETGFLVQGIPSASMTSDTAEASPLSSMSSHTRGDKLALESNGMTKSLPAVSILSEDGSTSTNSRASSRTASSRGRGLSKRKGKGGYSSRHSGQGSPTISRGRPLSPALKLAPRDEARQPGSISPLTTRRSTLRSNGRESPLSFSSTPPQWPHLSSSHRRSTSLNLPSSYSTYRRKFDESKLSTLKEGSQAAIENMPVSNSPRTHRNARLPVKHRRTVSFPDEVLQKFIGRDKLHPYHDFTLESDDPALFSLVETTQSRSDGRVYISSDVDPILASPGVFNSFRQEHVDNTSNGPHPNEKKSHRAKKGRSKGRHGRLPNRTSGKHDQKKRGHDRGVNLSSASKNTVGQSERRGEETAEMSSRKPLLDRTKIQQHHGKIQIKNSSKNKKEENFKSYHCIIQ